MAQIGPGNVMSDRLERVIMNRRRVGFFFSIIRIVTAGCSRGESRGEAERECERGRERTGS